MAEPMQSAKRLKKQKTDVCDLEIFSIYGDSDIDLAWKQQQPSLFLTMVRDYRRCACYFVGVHFGLFTPQNRLILHIVRVYAMLTFRFSLRIVFDFCHSPSLCYKPRIETESKTHMYQNCNIVAVALSSKPTRHLHNDDEQ